MPRTLIDMASSTAMPEQAVVFKPIATLFVNKLRDFVHEKMGWLRMVNSERVRKDVSHKLTAKKNKRTTEFDLRVGDNYGIVQGGCSKDTAAAPPI